MHISENVFQLDVVPLLILRKSSYCFNAYRDCVDWNLDILLFVSIGFRIDIDFGQDYMKLLKFRHVLWGNCHEAVLNRVVTKVLFQPVASVITFSVWRCIDYALKTLPHSSYDTIPSIVANLEWYNQCFGLSWLNLSLSSHLPHGKVKGLTSSAFVCLLSSKCLFFLYEKLHKVYTFCLVAYENLNILILICYFLRISPTGST